MSTILCIPSGSKEYLHVPVTANASLAGYGVEMALVGYGAEPGSGDWKTAVWDSTNAKMLIGLGTQTALIEGVYGVWVRITTAEERPVLYSGAVRIT